MSEEKSLFTYFIGVRFKDGVKNYFFGTNDTSFKIGERVVVESLNGLEIATVSKTPLEIEKYNIPFPLSPVLRKVTKEDLAAYQKSKLEGASAFEIAKEEVANLALPMHLLSAHYSLDLSKCTITYTADNRVDFRELLKVLAPELHCRIELRQLAPRDKAKAIGGLGPCGLPLCCSTFLTTFEGISISRAKNQMLSLNIPKLSGSCGKLMCCLAYEDDLYTEKKKDFPSIGSEIKLLGSTYVVESYNILSGNIRLNNGTETLLLSLEEFKEKTNPNYQNKKTSSMPIKDNSYHNKSFNREDKMSYQNNNSNKGQNRNPENKKGNRYDKKGA